MNGPDHFREAEKLLAYESIGAGDDPRDAIIVAAAQAHATLALAAAVALSTAGGPAGHESQAADAWWKAITT